MTSSVNTQLPSAPSANEKASLTSGPSLSELFPGMANDPFLSMKMGSGGILGGEGDEDNPSWSGTTGYSFSQPQSPKPRISSEDDDNVRGHQPRSKTPNNTPQKNGSSPKMRLAGSLYEQLQSSPQIQALNNAGNGGMGMGWLGTLGTAQGFGVSPPPTFTFASPPMPLIAASPMLVQQTSTAMSTSSFSGNDPVLNGQQQSLSSQPCDWMSAGKTKRRRSSPLIQDPSSYGAGMMASNQQQPIYGNQAPVSYYYDPSGQLYYQQQSQAYAASMPYLSTWMDVIARSQYPQRPPKVAMPPANHANNNFSPPINHSASNASSTPSSSSYLSPPTQRKGSLILPFKLSNTPSSTASPNATIYTEPMPTEELVLREMRESCVYIVEECKRINWDDVTVTTLKGFLKKLNQNASGRKEELIARVKSIEQLSTDFLEKNPVDDNPPSESTPINTDTKTEPIVCKGPVSNT